MVLMELYKYYINFSASNFLSKAFIAETFRNFDLVYAGNLIWPAIFVVSIISLINIYRNLDLVKDSSLNILMLISLVLLIILGIAIFIPPSESIEEFSGRFIQLSSHGTKTVVLTIFAVGKIYMSASECVVSFSALRKFYLFRSIWITIFVFIAGLGAIFIWVTAFKDDSATIQANNIKTDAGIVLGAAVWGGNRPSPVLRERINKGYELLENGTIKNIVLTGGGSPGEMTEADVAKSELLKKGIDQKLIFAENKSNSTLEQITYVDKSLYRRLGWQRIILISDNFHLPRSGEICRFYGIKTYAVSSDTPISTESNFLYSVKETFAILLFWMFGIG